MELTRLIVNLNETSVSALARAQEHTLDSKTDTVNRALQLYAWWVEMKTQGFTHHVGKDGEISEVIDMD